MKLLKNNIFYYSFGVLLSLGILIFMITAVFIKPVGGDASYYLSYSELIRSGFVPYHDFNMGYTPLFMYIMAGVRSLFNVDCNYSFDLSVWLLFLISNIFLVYGISKQLSHEHRLSVVAALLYGYISMRCEGLSMLLEVPSVTFALLSMLLLLKYSDKLWVVVVAGAFAFCSFFTKQYGAGYFLLMLFALCVNRQFKNAGLYFLGFVLAGATAILLVGTDCLHVFVNSSYSGYNEAGATHTLLTPVIKYVKASLTLMTFVPVLLFALVAGCVMCFKKRVRVTKSTIWYAVLCCGILGFLMQFIFAPYHHYYQYLLPMAAIASVWIVVKLDKCWQVCVWWSFIALTFIISAARVSYNGIYLNWKNQKKLHQIELAERIKDVIGDNDSILFIKEGKLMPYYYLTGYKPYDLNYSFGNLKEETYLDGIDASDYLLVKNNSEMLNTPLIIKAIEDNFTEIGIGDDDVRLYKKNN